MHTSSAAPGAAQPCGLICPQAFICAVRRAAFESVGIEGELSDGCPAEDFVVLYDALRTAWLAGRNAGRTEALERWHCSGRAA